MKRKSLTADTLCRLQDHLAQEPVALYLRTRAAGAVEDLRTLVEVRKLPYVVMRAAFGVRLVRRAK